MFRTLLAVNLLFAIAFGQLSRGQEGDGVLPLGPFDRGMVMTKSPYNLELNELSQASNCDFSMLGEIRCRWGYDNLGAIDGDVVVASASGYNSENSSKLDNQIYLVIRRDPDSILVYNIGSSIGKALSHYIPNGYYGQPKIIPWKMGALVMMPTYSYGPNNTLNSIHFMGLNDAGLIKTGLPTCTLATAVDGDEDGVELDSGAYSYAVTYRRDYIFGAKSYIEEGNSAAKTIVAAPSYVKLTDIPILSSDWHGTYDGYANSWTRRVYRTTADGSVMYHIGEIHNDSTNWIDTVADASINIFGPIYDEVIYNNCLDSLINNFSIRGFDVHRNRIVVVVEALNANGVAQTMYYRTIPFTNHTPLMYSSFRRSIMAEGRSLYTTGLTSCGGRLYTYGLSGIRVIPDITSNLFNEYSVSSAPLNGENCVECVDNHLWAMSTRGELFSTAFGTVIPSVTLVDSSEYRWATSWNKIGGSKQHKSYSMSVIKPERNTIVCAANDSSDNYLGYFRNGQLAWSRMDFGARSFGGDPVSNKLFWVDTASNTLEYWPSRRLNVKNWDGTDSSTIEWSITTGWMDFGSFDAVKQLKKVRISASLTDTLKIYAYWDGSLTVKDSGQVSSQETVVEKHSGDTYTWFPKRNNVGRYLMLKFKHPSCTKDKLVFRNAKVYYSITQR